MFLRILAPILFLATLVSPAQAGLDKLQVEAFLKTTGFDVAVESIAQSARHAPAMIGIEAEAFGADWMRLSESVFAPEDMTATAAAMLSEAMDSEMLVHGVEFYASDLGERLVAAENASHASTDDTRQDQGKAILAELAATNPARVELFKRMNTDIDAGNMSVRAMEEIQVRFLSAAADADVIHLQVDIAQLRAMIAEGREAMAAQMEEGSLANAALTYQPFSDEELLAYAEALEHPMMQKVYELMNAVQYEIMASRFEVLASRMSELHQGQDL